MRHMMNAKLLTVLASLTVSCAQAAAPGISHRSGATSSFNLTAAAGFINQPDGASVYSWGYGCANGTENTFLPLAIQNANCPPMQIPGPTLIVSAGDTVSVTLTNNLPAAA